jgi:HNH endonuclease
MALPPTGLLRELLHYDPETGSLTWKIRRHGVGGYPGHTAGYSIDTYKTLYVKIDGVLYQVPYIIWKMMTGRDFVERITYIDGDRSNNRWHNLREVNRSKLALTYRKPKNNKTGFKGVMFDNDNVKYRAQIRYRRKHYHLGSFDRIEDAIAARKKAEERFLGEFAGSLTAKRNRLAWRKG